MVDREFTFEHLNVVNDDVLNSLYGAEFSERSANDVLDPGLVVEANHALAEFLYGRDVAKLVRERKISELGKIYEANLEELSAPKELLEDVDLDGIGIIVVRPEIVEAVDQCIELVDKNGLTVIHDKPLTIDFRRYWSLYHHGLADPDSCNDFPTRTLNYINKPCHLIIVGKREGVNYDIPLSDLLTRYLKGSQGSYAQDTLRGDVAYTALNKFVQPCEQNFVSDFNVAFDPIGIYRHLVRGNIPSDRSHESADSPLLFYAGQGVHIPNSEEISRDLRILCAKEELEAMVQSSLLPIK